MSADWTEKYRPESLDDIIGNPSAVKEMRAWAASWEIGIPKKRAMVLIGSPGIGKTSSAIALARDMGWSPVELNASDQRTGDIIRNIALRGAYSNTFGDDGTYLSTKDGGRKLIILDEADNLFGNADRGAMPAINELIKTTKQPVILIVNDFFALSKKSSAVKTDTIQVTFRKPVARSIVSALNVIIKNEGITVEPSVVERVAENANGDMRAAVRDLESVSLGTSEVTSESAGTLSERAVRKDMYDLMDSIYRKSDPAGSRRMLAQSDADPETALIWIDENLPYEYRDPGDLVRGCEKLSRSDIFLGRVYKRQYYGFWSYAGDMMTAGVAVSRHSRMISRDRFRFPQFLLKMSRTKSVRALRNSVCFKLAEYIHTSTKRVGSDVLPFVKETAKNDAGFRIVLVKNVMLEPEELAFVLDCKMDSDIVKVTFLEAFPPKKEVPEPVPEIPKEPEAEKPKTEKKPEAAAQNAKKPQRNLFDF